MKHFISHQCISKKELDEIINLGESISNNPAIYCDCARGKILATLFFEPSTRTRLSFESAILSLGGNVIGFSEAGTSSASKGETLEDTIRVISNYADIIAMRHPQKGSAQIAAENAKIPVINAGDGSASHPTQTLTDLLTIKNTVGRLSNLKIAITGDLKFGRTVHSLISFLSEFYVNNTFYLFAEPGLELPDEILNAFSTSKFIYISDEDELLRADIDVLYMTRIQSERTDGIKVTPTFILTDKKANRLPNNAVILHPLPRNEEINTDVDKNPRAKYFEQTNYGKIVRMALIKILANL